MLEAIAFVTSSEGKFREASRLAPFPLERIDVELPEPQGLDVAAIVRAKAGAAFRLIERPLIVEDTSLELTALGGFPGPLVKWLLSAAGAESIPRLLASFDDRRATARAALGYADARGILIVNGTVTGNIVSPRGEHGFGWDVVFQPERRDRTFGEMETTEKNEISHRAEAFRHLRDALEARRRETGEWIPIDR